MQVFDEEEVDEGRDAESFARVQVFKTGESVGGEKKHSTPFACVYELHLPMCMDGKWPNGTGTYGWYLYVELYVEWKGIG